MRFDPIIGGVDDELFERVFMLRFAVGLCSGTLIATDGTTGFMLTAAHCLSTPALTAEWWGSTTTTSYPVTSQDKDSRYAPIVGAYDFGLVLISGVNGSPPVLPVLSDPNPALAVGAATTMVGFGRTVGGLGADPTPLRRRRVTPGRYSNGVYFFRRVQTPVTSLSAIEAGSGTCVLPCK